jgi:dipeptidase D
MVLKKTQTLSLISILKGIDMYIDGDWVRARGTTLGADNGLGVTAIMAV